MTVSSLGRVQVPVDRSPVELKARSASDWLLLLLLLSDHVVGWVPVSVGRSPVELKAQSRESQSPPVHRL